MNHKIFVVKIFNLNHKIFYESTKSHDLNPKVNDRQYYKLSDNCIQILNKKKIY